MIVAAEETTRGIKTPAVKCIDISKFYGATIALKDVSFEVQQGEIFGLLGPNGAGKTTAIRILKGMIKPNAGIASVLGHQVDKEANWVKQHTGYLPEEGSLLGRLTPIELCEFIGGLFGVNSQNSRERAKQLLTMFNLIEKKDELIENLSRGMKQKLSIICSIIHDPIVVLMDEPLASLDPSAAKMVKDFIIYLSREKEKTVLISSHRLSMVEDICDRVGIIHKGKILYIGTPQSIIKETATKTLEEAYLAILPEFENPKVTENGSLIEQAEKTEQTNGQTEQEDAEVQRSVTKGE
jgi:ABC-type multidrug transport system ATPase subunit